MYSISIKNTMNGEIVHLASGFSTSHSAMENAAFFLLSVIPSHVHLKVSREEYGLSIYRRVDIQQMRPSGRYKYKEVNGEMRKHALMEKAVVSSFEKWYDVILSRNQLQHVS